MVPRVRARQDSEGCGCLACREVDVVTLRRDVLDILAWQVSFYRTYPSVPGASFGIVLAGRVVSLGFPRYLPDHVVQLSHLVVGIGLLVFLRAYIAATVAEELTDSRTSPWHRVRYSIRRLPGLIAVFIGTFTVAIVVTSTVLTGLAVVVFVSAGGAPAALPRSNGILWTLLLFSGLLFWFLLVKLWLAFEACVLGHYSPLESLRLGWRLTGSYRRRFVCVFAGLLASLGVVPAGGLLSGIDASLRAASPVVNAVGTSLGELLVIVWYGVFAHLYIQGVVAEP